MNSSACVYPAIIVFPGSNCEQDMAFALGHGFALEPLFLWHMEQSIPDHITHVIIPGGFSFGDYLRAGALAAHSPIMKAIGTFAQKRGKILGICNGFQILCESGLLPGVLLNNSQGRFVCSIQTVQWFGMSGLKKPMTLQLPIAHNEGRFFATHEVQKNLFQTNSIVLSYRDVDAMGNACVNGSCSSIAGLIGGPFRNILGMMPHPERAMEQGVLGSDGRIILQEFLFGESHEESKN